ncbi:hypothetical protein BC940DRAFT_156942 [Gongronella butleri]|nr:hypothetical protein BC940DRAFT_156942 [Gongronella butleri]
MACLLVTFCKKKEDLPFKATIRTSIHSLGKRKNRIKILEKRTSICTDKRKKVLFFSPRAVLLIFPPWVACCEGLLIGLARERTNVRVHSAFPAPRAEISPTQVIFCSNPAQFFIFIILLGPWRQSEKKSLTRFSTRRTCLTWKPEERAAFLGGAAKIGGPVMHVCGDCNCVSAFFAYVCKGIKSPPCVTLSRKP